MKISAVIDAYNAESYIQEAIESVFTQSRVPDELIVVDDGSTDQTYQRILEATEDRNHVSVIKQSNKGQLSCLTTGILAAKGDFIALLDGDDAWKKNHLKEAEETFLKHPKLSLYFCDYETVGGDFEGVTRYPDTLFKTTFALTALSEAFLGNVPATMVFQKEVLHSSLPLPIELEKDWIINADNVLVWLSCFLGRQKFSSAQKNVLYRMHENNMHKREKEGEGKATKRLATKRLFEYFRRQYYIPDDIHKCLIREYKAHSDQSKALKKSYLKAVKCARTSLLTKLGMFSQIYFR